MSIYWASECLTIDPPREQGGEVGDADDDEDEEDYVDAPLEKSATSSVVGTKRSREEDEDVAKLAEDGGAEEAEEAVSKKARTVADDEVGEQDDEVEV